MASATQATLDFLSRLLDERSYPPTWRDDLEAQAERSGGVLTQAAASRAIDYLKTRPMKDGRPGPPPTPKMAKLLDRLLEEKEIPEGLAEHAALVTEAKRRGILTFDQARAAIDTFLPLPDKPRPAGDLPTVPDGRYALGTKEDFVLYRVRNGRIRVFVDRIEPSEHMEPVRGAEQRRVLQDIAADVRTAALLYGEVTDRCYRCDKLLSDPKSLISKVGRDCAKHIGVAWGQPPSWAKEPIPEPALIPTAGTVPATPDRDQQPVLFDLGL